MKIVSVAQILHVLLTNYINLHMVVDNGLNIIMNSFRSLIAAGLRAPQICRVGFDGGLNIALCRRTTFSQQNYWRAML